MKISSNNITLAIIILIGFLLLILRILFIPSPIYGGDEYAYYISGLYLKDLDNLYNNDINLQKVSTYFFLIIVNYLGKYFNNLSLSVIFLNITLFISSAIIYIAIARKYLTNIECIFFTIGIVLLPFSAYSLSVMPDIFYYFIYTILFYVTFKYFYNNINIFSFYAGFLLGLLILLKPHASSIIISIYILFIARFIFDNKFKINNITTSILITSFSIYIILIAIQYISINKISLIPNQLFGKVYIDIISNPQNSIMSIYNLVIYNFISHIVLISMIFFSAFPIFASSANNLLHYKAIGLDYFNVFILLILSSTLLMTSIFTGKIALFNINEIFLILGRYYEFIFPSLACAIIINREFFLKNSIITKFTGAVIATLPLIWVVFFQGTIKLEPWTTTSFQILSTFSQSDNEIKYFKTLFLIFISIQGLLIIIHPRKALTYILAIFCVTSLSGFYLTTKWQFINRLETAKYTADGHEVAKIIPKEQISDGVIFSDDRYGVLSYTLFGIKANNLIPTDITENNFKNIIGSENNKFKWALISNRLNYDLSGYRNIKSLPNYKLIIFNKPPQK